MKNNVKTPSIEIENKKVVEIKNCTLETLFRFDEPKSNGIRAVYAIVPIDKRFKYLKYLSKE